MNVGLGRAFSALKVYDLTGAAKYGSVATLSSPSESQCLSPPYQLWT
jgi:hypothetical protein